jgi:type III restriction enzyme
LEIVNGIDNHAAAARNPPKFLAAACALIRDIELDEMLRTLSYHPTGDSIPLTEFLAVIDTFLPVEPTPTHGVYDKIAYESAVERAFAKSAEGDNEVVCFLKLPACYRIPTPIGIYEPDFGLVLKRRNLRSNNEAEYYFVVETKNTSNLDDRAALTDSERWKIRCALKHFDAIGIEAKLAYLPYVAPVKDYRADFKDKVPQP